MTVTFHPELDAVALTAAGYVHTFHPASWTDVGGCESGPKVTGHADTHVWTLDCGHCLHEVVLEAGRDVVIEYVPAGPADLDDQF